DNKEVRDNQLEIIMEESDRLNTLVNDVMDLSLLQAGQKKLELRSFCINKKIEDILLRFNLLVQNDGFNFNINNHFGRDVFVLADEVRIEQVLYNLINNAVNHIGDVKNITISLVQDGQEVRVEVNDTGTGIPQEEIPHIWDRYYKSFKKAGGTGLGLSIVKAILINHKSRFGVYSTLNVGSTFWFTLQMYIE
ncbi:MAG: HAMP domain-containing sensor histidine kinase, partial [Oscillospiraceae bacterium]